MSLLLVSTLVVAGAALAGTRIVPVTSAEQITVADEPQLNGDPNETKAEDKRSAVAASSSEQPAADQTAVTSQKLNHTLTVVDWNGNPVSGASVKVWQFVFESTNGFGGGSRSPEKTDEFEGLTDADGKIIVPYPVTISPQAMRVTQLGLQINHPEFPQWMDYRNLKATEPLQLARPVLLSIAATLDAGRVVTSDLYASTKTETSWKFVKGRLESGPIDVTDGWLRVVYAPKGATACFSDVIKLSELPIQENRILVDVVLHSSIRLKGRLSDSVSRPVHNGQIAARATTVKDSVFTSWSMETSVAEDGTFELDNVPANSHVQIIAMCDGGVSRSPRPSEVKAYCEQFGYKTERYIGSSTGRIAAQLYFASATAPECVILMDSTGDVEVMVEDWDGKPVAGAKVRFSPNQAWHNSGSQVLGIRRDSMAAIQGHDPLAADGVVKSGEQSLAAVAGVSDADGKVIIRNLPAGVGWHEWDNKERESPRYIGFSVSHPDYALMVKEPRRITTAGKDRESVDMVPGGLANIRVRMERRDPPPNATTVAESGAPATMPRASEKNEASSPTNKPQQPQPTTTPPSPQANAAHNGTSANDIAPQDKAVAARPISVSGVARNANGEPVAKATIYLVSVNSIDKMMASTTSDDQG